MASCNRRLKTKYLPGQLWEYKTRAGEEHTRLLILKCEKLDGEKIVHVKITGGINFPDHMPFSKEAIDKSVLKLCNELSAIPDFHDGYSYWKECYVGGEAGVYEISVSDALNLSF